MISSLPLKISHPNQKKLPLETCACYLYTNFFFVVQIETQMVFKTLRNQVSSKINLACTSAAMIIPNTNFTANIF